jgi:3-oxoacyl-[acyl-carrier-protein] synthase II
MSRRVFVTGLGIISPLGLDTASTWHGLTHGVSGVAPITAFDPQGFDTQFAAEVKGFDPESVLDKKQVRRMDRFAQFAAAAAHEACAQAGLDKSAPDPSRIAAIVGSGIGGIITLSQQYAVLQQRGPRRVSPFLIPMMLADMAPARVSMIAGAMGPNFCVVSSCSSGSDAIGQGWQMIRRNEVSVVVAGGSEAPICPIAMAGFNSLRALSRRNEEPQTASRPFDANRDGFVMAEGAAVLVLESGESVIKRGAIPLAELAGYAATSDAYHLTEPAPGGQSAARAMKSALKRAGVSHNELGYVNAHGTSTPLNDRQETQAIKFALGQDAYRVPISSTKSMTGHLLGAGGALEAAACILAINSDLIPPTINLTHPDPQCDLNYTPHTARQEKITSAMSNAFGFGGHNSVLVFTSGQPS